MIADQDRKLALSHLLAALQGTAIARHLSSHIQIVSQRLDLCLKPGETRLFLEQALVVTGWLWLGPDPIGLNPPALRSVGPGQANGPRCTLAQTLDFLAVFRTHVGC